MTAGVPRWSVRLTAAAENDFREILRWTFMEFGERQSRTYAETLSAALRDLTVGPSIAGVKHRDEIAKGSDVMRYMLDTNICIYLINHRPASVRKRLAALKPGDAGVSSVTVAELAYGVAKTRSARNRAALEGFLLPLEIADFGLDAAMAYGDGGRAGARRAVSTGKKHP